MLRSMDCCIKQSMFHVVINSCQNVHIAGVKVIVAGERPNTDGIHNRLSRNVMITESSIKTGDDCIFIGLGTKNLGIEHVTCCLGHLIRIKAWARPSNGFVQGVRFIDAVMENIQNAIIIDQNYCHHKLISQVSDVTYQDIRGTSTTPVAIDFDCSTKNPCTGVRLQNVNLRNLNEVALVIM